jgi:hypothetical protein
LTERLFGEINAHLSERGLFVGKGTIMDATMKCPNQLNFDQWLSDHCLALLREGSVD